MRAVRIALTAVCLVWVLGEASPNGGAVMSQVRSPGSPGSGGVPPAVEVRPGAIRGVVTASATGEPIVGAEVRLAGGPSKQPALPPAVTAGTVTFPPDRSRFARTDARGRYEFVDVESGRYTVRAAKVGYLSMAYGQRVPLEAAANIELASGQTLEGINVTLFKAAVIVARVLDPFGDPAPGIIVRPLQNRLVAGREGLFPSGSNLLANTDDRGELRLFGLAPGDYYLSANRSPAAGLIEQRGREPETYYPGTLSAAEAQPVTVREGEEIAVTLSLLSTRRSTVAGTLIDAAGVPLGNARLQLTQQRIGGISGVAVALAPDGTFRATDLPPGEFVIQVRPGLENGRREYAHVTFRVDDGVDVTGMVVQTKPGATIRGRVVLDNVPAAERPRPGALSIAPVFTRGGMAVTSAEIQDDGTFAIADLIGAGVLRVKGPAGWFLDRVVLGSRDVADTPLEFEEYTTPVEIHLTRRRTELTGTAIGAQGNRTVSYVVVAFAEDRRLWTSQSRYLATARPDQTGRFTLLGLPPGRYHVIAVNYLQAGTERDPRILERLAAHAGPLTLGEGESRAMDFRIVERY